jgi:hypothetical protein
MRQFVVLLSVLGALVAPGAVSGATTPDARRAARAEAAERAGRLNDAYVLLGRLAAPTKAQATHHAHLGAALQARETARALTAAGDDAGARKALDAARAALDPAADRYAVVVLARASATAAAAALVPADAAARATLRKGDALGADERWTDAAAVYKTVAGAPAGTLSAAVRQTATVKQLRAERRAIEAEPSPFAAFWIAIWHGLRDALKWALIPLLLGVALWLARRVRQRRPVKGRTSLALSESGGDAKDQDRRDHALALELADAIQDVRYASLAADGSAVDERRDLDGTAAPLVHVGGGVSKADALGQDITFAVGPLKVSPLQLFYFGRWALARPGERALTGTLRADAAGAQLSVELSGPGGVPPRHWSARAAGDGARAAVIREVAQKYVVECGFSYISNSYSGFVAYNDALEELRAADRQAPADRLATLEAVRAELERALGHDAFNLLARLRLGGVLRAMGLNDEAAAQFERVRDDVQEARRLPAGARALVARHPELFYVAMFNRAVALGKRSAAPAGVVSTQLALLVARLAPEPVLPVLQPAERPALMKALRDATWPAAMPSAGDRERLHVLALSAWAASLVATIDRSDLEDTEKLRARRARIRVRVLAVRADLAEGRLAGPASSAAVRDAEAVIEDALARVAYRDGRFGEAGPAARSALVIAPDLGNAHITLAEIAMAKKGRQTEGEAAEAERHLQAALAISPRDARARYLLGRLYQMNRDLPKAQAAFAALGADWRALEQLGDVFLAQEQLPDAVRCFVHAQARRPSGDYRANRLVSVVLELRKAAEARLRARDGEEILRAGARVVKAARPDKRARAVARLAALEEAVADLTSRPPVPPAPPAPPPAPAPAA